MHDGAEDGILGLLQSDLEPWAVAERTPTRTKIVTQIILKNGELCNVTTIKCENVKLCDVTVLSCM